MDLILEGLVVALAAWAIVRWVLLPVQELLQELRRIAAGDYRPVILRGIPRFFSEAASHLRITAETLARQKAVIEGEEFSLAMILEDMTEGVVITGPDLKIRLVNKAAARMFQLGNTTPGLRLQEVFVDHDLLKIAEKTISTGVLQGGELTLGIPGQRARLHLLVTSSLLKTSRKETSNALLLVLHDVTELRELESIRREFMANVSHEFRTPLSVINGYLETLEEEGPGSEMFHKSLSVMRRHANRLNLLLEDLLTISRMEEKSVRLDSTPADLVPLLRNIVEQMELEIKERNVDLQLLVAGELPLVTVDAYLLEQAFSNLLANALRHGKTTGGRVEISLSLPGSELAVSFRDNGPGIPFKDQEHVFERFYRVGGDRARRTGGTGLGLSIVKHVVQVHDGRITLESKPGEGSVFTIYLPIAKK
jgi:two-component system phosphate regulon sensor histidine kinase PhoR